MNQLYPIFLKASQLDILIVGGGYVALEKLTFLLKSSPGAKVRLVATWFIPEVMDIIKTNDFHYEKKKYQASDIQDQHIVIGATNDEKVNEQIHHDAKARHILVNIADNPPLCDFYMGGIVTKGNLKLAISTNGKSPTMAKRLRQLFEAILPESIDELLQNMRQYRSHLAGDFEHKVAVLNDLTKSFLTEKQK